MTPRSDSRPVTPGTVVLGSVAGAAAFVVGYLVAFATGTTAGSRVLQGFEPLRDAGAHLAPGWKVGAWLFYDAHFVGTRVRSAGMTVDLVSLAGVEFLYLVPPAMLLLAGSATALLAGADEPRAGLTVGLTVAVGYLLLAVVGLSMVGFAGTRPGGLRAVVVAGVVYPVVFGGVGGTLVGVVRADRRPDESAAGAR